MNREFIQEENWFFLHTGGGVFTKWALAYVRANPVYIDILIL